MVVVHTRIVIGFLSVCLVLDQLLITRGGKVDLLVSIGSISSTDPGNYVSVQGGADPDPWVADQEVVELVAELNELLFGFGLLDGVHTSIIMGFRVKLTLLLQMLLDHLEVGNRRRVPDRLAIWLCRKTRCSVDEPNLVERAGSSTLHLRCICHVLQLL